MAAAQPPRSSIRSRPSRFTLYLVTDTEQCGLLGVTETVRQAVLAGVTAVQLRDPHATDADFVAMGAELADLLAGTQIPLIVNDRAHLVDDIGADGLHVGQDDLDPSAAREIIGTEAILGLSVHSAEQARAAEADREVIDYLGVGPVWPTGSKPDAARPTGVEGLAEIVSASHWPCVAIGGITVDRAADVRAAGAAGMAVISAICGQPDVGRSTAELVDAWRAGGSR